MADLRSQLEHALSGSYTLERELGGGGMSRVFVADETRLGRKVVVKVLSPELAAGLSAERFEREIKLAASLQQANIVPVLTTGEMSGLPYYTMPYVEGESLRARLGTTGPLSTREAVGILKDVARALAYAHERGVVHRDIKPDNVLLSGGTAVVTDFGIAKAVLNAQRDASATRATLTQLGTAIGTPAYMAPEQAAGDPSTDHRADIYAFGCLAYELLAGHPPFHSLTPQKLLAAHMGAAPEEIRTKRPDTPRPVAELVMRCLAKDAADRPQSAPELLRTLDPASSGGSELSAHPAVLGGPGMLRKALAVYALAFIAVALLAKVAIAWIGLPEWVFPGALIVMAVGLPLILFTGYAQRVLRLASAATPTFTPGGSAATTAHGTMASLALKASPHLSWRRAGVGGVYALAGFAVLVGGFMLLRALGIGPAGSLFARGSLGEHDRVLVADFRVAGPDSSLGGVVTETLRTGLAQSHVISTASISAVADGLRRMNRAPSARLDLATARDLAQREGMKAVIYGEVTPAGQGFILTARLVAAASGEELASFREAARDATELIPAIDRITRDLRGRIGESLRAVHGSPALERVTTASLPALRRYTDGMRLHYRDSRFAEAAAAFEDAIRLDSTFTLAYVRAANSYYNGALRSGRRDSLRLAAFGMRERLPGVERALVEAAYYAATGRGDLQIASDERAVAIDPADPVVWNELGNLHNYQREYAKAESAYRRSMALPDANSFPWINISTALIAQGRIDDARAAIAAADRRFPVHPTSLRNLAIISLVEGHFDSVAILLDSARRLTYNTPARAAYQNLVSFAQMRGRLREAAHLAAALRASDLKAGVGGSGQTGRIAGLLDSLDAEISIAERPPEEAVRLLDALLERFPSTGRGGLTPTQLLNATVIYARAGRVDRAWAVMRRYERDVVDSVARRATYPSYHLARAEIALGEKRFPAAIVEIRASNFDADGQPHQCPTCTDAQLARAFDLAGQRDSALAAFERYVSNPSPFRLFFDPEFYAASLKRLGELYEDRGDRAKAAHYYSAFVELWKGADPELQPRVVEVKKRLARLGSER